MGNTCGVYEAMWLARLHVASAHALYLHIPFCARKCAYCDFSSWETERDDPLMDRYAHALGRQLAEVRALGFLDSCETAYVGGGTPTLLGAEALGGLVSKVRDACPRLAELTCEANPDSLSDDVLRALYDSGATRLSIGVQSLDDEELRALGRLHDAQTARERVAAAVASGLDVSVDLMCAIPHQSDHSWRATLDGALALGVGHVSVYPLQIEEDTPLACQLGDDDPPWHSSEVQAARMEVAEEALIRAGLHRYEVASYAKSGKACRHNQAYWTGLPYLGLGTGASSMLTREVYQRLRSVWSGLPAIGDDVARVRLTITSGRQAYAETSSLEQLHADLELLDEAQAAAEDLMLGMRMAAGVNPGLVEHARGVLGMQRVDDVLERCVARGLAAWHGGRLVPTHEGWLLGNELYGELWGLAEGTVRTDRV